MGETNKLTGKGKKAKKRLEHINDEIEGIIEKLKAASNEFQDVIKNSNEFENSNKPKKRSMIEGAPDRIEFQFTNKKNQNKKNQMKFYIDFTVVASEGDDPADIKGSIIYGANRTLCFKDCIFPKNTKNCKLCERINRCDGLEDKPLIQFLVNKTGMIKSRGELEDEWWIKKEGDLEEDDLEEGDLADLHYRALDHIWKDSIDWTNENISP